MAEGQRIGNAITVVVKSPNIQKTVELHVDANIKEFKAIVAENFEAKPEQLHLTFDRKILRNNGTLKTYNIKGGLTVHLVIKAPSRPERSSPNQKQAD